jgi:glycosyltransferase involved in cell wall biosynthesis
VIENTNECEAKVPVSVLIPIKNEASNLPRCLASVQWADQIFVIDSYSTDNSASIARSFGANLVQFHYSGGWPKKKNWALENLDFKHEWVFILDADEVLQPQVKEEVNDIVSGIKNKSEDAIVGYWINRRFYFLGKWLKHAYFPNWNLRLFKHKLGRYEMLSEEDTKSGDVEIHEHVIVQGKTARLEALMDHYAFPSVEVFVEKHNRYSNWEAAVALSSRKSGSSARQISDRQVSGRRALKELAAKLPFRPVLRFVYVYIWQRGFLDGIEGYYFAMLHAFYEFLVVVKTFELQRLRDNETAEAAVKTAGKTD